MSYELSINIMGILYIFMIIYIYIYNHENNYLNKIQKIYLTLIFILLATPFNVFIKNVGDYNLTEIFNFWWRFKIKGLSLVDIGMFFYFLIYIRQIIIEIFKDCIVRIYFFRNLIYVLIGIISYIYMQSYFLDSGKKIISILRGPIYFSVIFFITSRYLNLKIEKLKYFKLVDAIILFSIVSSFLFNIDFLWIRHGMRVTILGQEWGYGLIAFYVTYLFKNYTHENKIKLLLISVLLFLNFYKGVLIYQSLMILIYIFIYKKNSISDLLIKAVFSLVAIFLGVYIFNFISSATSVSTRKIQYNEYINYISKKGDYPYYLGLGLGAPYKNSNENKIDLGEIKAIDIEKYPDYKFEIQTQYISNFKDIGLLGIGIVVVFNLLLMYILMKEILKNKDNEFFSVASWLFFENLFLIMYFLLNIYMAIFSGFILGRYLYLRRIKNEKNDIN